MTQALSTTILLWVLYAAIVIATKYISDRTFSGTGGRYANTAQVIVLLVIPLLYRYFLYRYFRCCEKATAETADAAQSTGNEALTQPLMGAAGTESQNQLTNTPPRRVRYPFLDNVKVFLTALVVFHHVSCAFSIIECTIIGVQSKLSTFSGPILVSFITINQGYFMPLFFFISAFFVPTSYAKGREKFLRSKWKRILLPALVASFIIYPISYMFSDLYTSNGTWQYYFFKQAQTWFLYWLLLLNWVYMSIIDSTDTSSTSSTANDNGIEVETVQEQQETKIPFPSTWTRLLYSVSFCGIIISAIQPILGGELLTMPTSVWGSLTADFFMFYAGIQAKKHGWLEKDLAEQLDMPLYWFFPMVLAEMITFTALPQLSFYFLGFNQFPPITVFVLQVVAGAYCVDMSLAVLIIFQRWFNYETKLSKMLARSAYCVYLIHAEVLLVVTISYLEIYKSVFGTGDDVEVGRVVGGFIFVNVVTQVLVWPLSYGLTRLPVLRDII